jgi:uncharacterized protein YukE
MSDGKMTSNILARFALASAIPLALVTCASKPAPASYQAAQQELKRAQQDYASCLHRAATDLDDGKSATDSVARAVRSYCIPEYEHVIDLQSSDMKPEAKEEFRRKTHASEVEESIAAVLEERRDRKAPSR